MSFIRIILCLIIALFVFIRCADISKETEIVDSPVVEIEPLPVYRVTSRQLRIRRGPGTRFEEMLALPHNAQVVFIDKVETKDEGVWFLIQTISSENQSKIEGFVYSLHLEKVE